MFRPERWLEDEAQLSVMERYFLPFGHGSRTCIGKNISLMEISKLIPQLVRMFDFEITHPAGQLKLENVWFVRQTNFNCRVRLRAGLKSI
jgi:cytochrome P450